MTDTHNSILEHTLVDARLRTDALIMMADAMDEDVGCVVVSQANAIRDRIIQAEADVLGGIEIDNDHELAWQDPPPGQPPYSRIHL